jgi:uncharacterized membrane protein
MRLFYDESHKEPSFDVHYSDLSKHLKNINREVEVLKTSPITADVLKKCGLLVISFPQKSFGKGEIDSIVEFVKGGGGLFLVGEEWDFNHFKKNLNSVSERFNISFNDDEILDPKNHIQKSSGKSGDYYFKVTSFEKHPVTEGVDGIIIYGGCTLKIADESVESEALDEEEFQTEPNVVEELDVGADEKEEPAKEKKIEKIDVGTHEKEEPVKRIKVEDKISGQSLQVIVKGSEDSYSSGGYYEAGEFPPILSVTEYGKGRVVCIGDGSILRNSFINEGHNKQLALNIINWLSLRGSGASEEPEDVIGKIEELEQKYNELNLLYSSKKISNEEYLKKVEDFAKELEYFESKL